MPNEMQAFPGWIILVTFENSTTGSSDWIFKLVLLFYFIQRKNICRAMPSIPILLFSPGPGHGPFQCFVCIGQYLTKVRQS